MYLILDSVSKRIAKANKKTPQFVLENRIYPISQAHTWCETQNVALY